MFGSFGRHSLRVLECKVWTQERETEEGKYGFSRLLRRVDWQIVTVVLEAPSASIFRVKQFKISVYTLFTLFAISHDVTSQKR